MFDTLEFLSLIDEKSAVTNAVLTCREFDSGILLNIRRDKISWRRTGFQDIEVSLDESTEGFGWKRFKLGFANKTVTLERDGKPCLGKGLDLGCAVGKVSIKSGRFTGKCSPGTPGPGFRRSTVEIPLAVSGNHIREEFILFSPEPFNPSFKMKGAEVELGLRGDSLVTSGEMEPLPAEAHEVALQIVSDGSSAKLKMTKDGEVVLETALEDSPKCVQVSGNKRFVLVQKIRQDSPREDASSPNTAQCSETVHESSKIVAMWCLLGVLAVVATVALAYLIFYCCCLRISKNNPTRRRQVISTENSEPKSSHRLSSLPGHSVYPAYLEPVSLPGPPRVQGNTQHVARVHCPSDVFRESSSPDHTYEEVDEVGFVNTARLSYSDGAEHADADRSSSSDTASSH
ncbi:uncharacterized protein LOC122254959 [Penaeus japonicus]|uniref:uncharacterized protein LOC122254959 n=1 Tax=Penaeus japonicus TaxID=27405 RepID=UPI001C70D548|nr:uncharacterized protein LOC122254959 [Penaeus japonicus]